MNHYLVLRLLTTFVTAIPPEPIMATVTNTRPIYNGICNKTRDSATPRGLLLSLSVVSVIVLFLLTIPNDNYGYCQSTKRC